MNILTLDSSLTQFSENFCLHFASACENLGLCDFNAESNPLWYELSFAQIFCDFISGGFLGLEPNCETPLVHDDNEVDDLCRDETKASYSFFSPGSASRCRSGQLVGRSPVA